MILGDTKTEPVPATTLDDLLRRAAARRPDSVALADPPDRESFTDGPPRRFTFAETDHIVSAIASRLRNLGLQTDAIVGIQLPNTVESVLTFLGVLRAGMIAAPLPLLWRHADAAAALGRLNAKAIVTASRIGNFDACATAVQVAADVFPIRHVCGFGQNLPDGVMAFGDLLHQAPSETAPAIEREDVPAAHVALVTFDVTSGGLIPVARNHAELIAGGLATLLEGGIEPDARLLGCCATGSFAGLALTVMPWLLSGGTLSLHHGFDCDAFAVQCREDRCDTIVVPGALVPQLAEAGLLADAELKNMFAVWRAPERHLASPAWQRPGVRMTDMLVFGETALVGSHRDADGLPVPLPAFAVTAPRNSANAVPVAQIARTGTGTLALRGPMVPGHPFPPGAERLPAPHLKADAEGFVDTGYACRIDRMMGTVTVTGPPPGIVSVGGYRFVLSELEDLVRRTDRGAFVTALPDALAGHRLAGISGGTGDVGAGLAGLGVNPLITSAFSDRGPNAA
jgi:non-ribosomal peptide synthetase component E (peptide arylation enzyme)